MQVKLWKCGGGGKTIEMVILSPRLESVNSFDNMNQAMDTFLKLSFSQPIKNQDMYPH